MTFYPWCAWWEVVRTGKGSAHCSRSDAPLEAAWAASLQGAGSELSTSFSQDHPAIAAHASLIFSINNNIEQMEWSFNYS